MKFHKFLSRSSGVCNFFKQEVTIGLHKNWGETGATLKVTYHFGFPE
jgi:hypothetical protein